MLCPVEIRLSKENKDYSFVRFDGCCRKHPAFSGGESRLMSTVEKIRLADILP
jgi:hypothetical protein